MHQKPIRFSTVAVMLAVILLMMILSHLEEHRQSDTPYPACGSVTPIVCLLF